MNQTFDLYIENNTGINNCARCEGTHDNLEWTYFNKPIVIDESTIIGYATCPVTDDPILFVVKDEKCS